MKTFVVVPTIRENSILRFLNEWKKNFEKHKVNLIIVEDNSEKTFDIKTNNYKFKIFHYSWEDIDRALSRDSWIIPRRTSAIKSYGFWKAYKMNADIIVALDDDCYPIENYIKNFISMFGLRQENSKNVWTYRNYKIDWNRIYD
ncbi:MAG: hypothetical protein ACP5QN_02550, partial [Minisyncoccia bacterium]